MYKRFMVLENIGNFKKGDIITGMESPVKGFIIPVSENIIKVELLEEVEMRCSECSEE